MRMRQLFLVGYYFLSNMAAEFGLKVEDTLHSFDGVQTKIKEIEARTAVRLYK